MVQFKNVGFVVSGVVETTVESGCGFEDVTTLMEWNSEGVASLPGSDIKFTINEFGMLEMVDLNRVSPILRRFTLCPRADITNNTPKKLN